MGATVVAVDVVVRVQGDQGRWKGFVDELGLVVYAESEEELHHRMTEAIFAHLQVSFKRDLAGLEAYLTRHGVQYELRQAQSEPSDQHLYETSRRVELQVGSAA